MNAMIRYMVAHPVAANLTMAATIVLAVLSLPGAERSMAPDVPLSLIEVTFDYPGSDPATVSESICRRVERAVDRIPELIETTCEAVSGRARLVLKKREFSDFDRFFSDVRVAIDAIADFPSDVEPPVIQPTGTDIAVVTIAVAAPMPRPQLKDYADGLKSRLEALTQVSKIAVQGFSQREFEVSVPVSVLRRLGTSVPQLAEAIRVYNVDAALGTLEAAASDSRIRLTELRDTPESLKSLAIEGDDKGSLIALEDIARISDTFSDPHRQIEFDEQPAVLLTVFRTRSEDTIDVFNAVASLIASEQVAGPAQLTLIQDTSALVGERLGMMVRNGVFGLALVAVSLWLFFGLRFALWVAAGLPVAVAGTIIAMVALGISFNLITTVAMLVAIGLVMDDSIVIAENIAANRVAGANTLDSVVSGVGQVVPAVLSSFATTAAVFAPLLFLAGELGAVMAFIPLTLLLILSISLAEAIFVLPHHLAHAPIAAASATTIRGKFERLFLTVKDKIATKIFRWSVTQPHLAIGLAVGTLFLSIGILASGLLKFEAFPNVEGDVVEAHILMNPGVSALETERAARLVTTAARQLSRELSGDDDTASIVRHYLMNLGINKVAGLSGSQAATISLELAPAAERSVSAATFLNLWRERVGSIPNVSIIDYADQDFGAGGRPISFRLEGDKPESLKAAAEDLKTWLWGYAGIIAVGDDVTGQQPEFQLKLRPLAVAQGMTADNIAHQVRGALFGSKALEVAAPNHNYDVYVRVNREELLATGDLKSLPILLPSGTSAPLGSLADLELGRVPARITRVNGRRTITVEANIDIEAANAAAIIGDTQSEFLPVLLETHPDMALQIQGQSADAARTGTSILVAFVGGLAIVYLLLGLQFRSYGLPLVVMSIIPLCLIGVVWGHLLTGMTFSIPSLIGFVGLSGIAVNNAILLVHAARTAYKDCENVEAAIVAGCRNRFRAMMLTSMTTLAGLFPLLMETSHHAVSIQPLVTSLAFGLFGATVIILIFIPAVLSLSPRTLTFGKTNL